MAQKRMFNNSVIGSDDFLEMPETAQNLYFHLSMQADDDGFVDNWKSIMRMTGRKEDDLKILITKCFIIPFDTGVIVIRHWRLNNYIRNDRYKETIYKAERSLLSIDNNNVYQMDTNGIPNGYPDKNRLDKIRLDKSSSSSNNNNKYINNKTSDSCVDGLQTTTTNDSCVDGSLSGIDSCVDEFQEVIDFYQNNIGMLTPYGLEILESYKSELNKDVIIYAMEKAVTANARNMNYIKSILNNWSKKGLKTLIEAKEESENKKRTETKEEKKARKLKELKEALGNDTS